MRACVCVTEDTAERKNSTAQRIERKKKRRPFGMYILVVVVVVVVLVLVVVVVVVYMGMFYTHDDTSVRSAPLAFAFER